MMTKGSKCRWGNFIGLVVFPLWIRCEDDPLKYIRRARATMDKKKISMEPLISYGILKLIMKIFGEKVKYKTNINFPSICLSMYIKNITTNFE